MVLRPEIVDTGSGTLVHSSAKLDVWTRGEDSTPPPLALRPVPPVPSWKLIKSLVIDNGRSPHPGTP
jgi:hypothetical protein